MDNEEIKRFAEKIKASGGESWILLAIMAIFGFNNSKLEQNE